MKQRRAVVTLEMDTDFGLRDLRSCAFWHNSLIDPYRRITIRQIQVNIVQPKAKSPAKRVKGKKR